MIDDLRRWIDAATTLNERCLTLAEGVLPESALKAAARYLLHAIDTGYTSESSVIAAMFEDGYLNTYNKNEARQRGFRTKLRGWCADSVMDMAWTLTTKFQSDRLSIWRMITAPADWQPDPNQHPGIFWSWDCMAAEAHWGANSNGDVDWLLYAEVVNRQINWPVTLAKNCMPDYEEEKEIELKQVPVTIISYERKNAGSCR